MERQRYWKSSTYEYERGWGSKVDDTVYAISEEIIKDFITEYNADNTATVAPDWYMVAIGCDEENDFDTVTALNKYFSTNRKKKRVWRSELKKLKLL